jgi:hypothetical protein
VVSDYVLVQQRALAAAAAAAAVAADEFMKRQSTDSTVTYTAEMLGFGRVLLRSAAHRGRPRPLISSEWGCCSHT